MRKFGVPVVVAINRFGTDTQAEVEFVSQYCADQGVPHAYSEVFARGGEGGEELARTVCETIAANPDAPERFAPIYDDQAPIPEKIETVCREIYHAGQVSYAPAALKAVKEIETLGLDRMPICVAKTQYSLSDDPSLLGAPEGFTITVKDVKVSAGAGFIVVYTGSIMTMPGLPKSPAALQIDVDENGVIDGLF